MLESIELEGRAYELEVHRRVQLPPDAPRLVVVSYVPNVAARGVLAACLDAIAHFTPEAHELWVVDNNSPADALPWLRERRGVNLVLSRTEPAPPDRRGWWTRLTGGIRQQRWGSYANAVGVELAVRVVEPSTRYLMTLHMDTAPCRAGWLTYLTGKLDERTAAAGVRMDRARVPEGVLHVLGCLVDFQRARALGLSWYPDLPRLDVGDRITTALRAAGLGVHACRNSHTDPALIAGLPPPFTDLPVDRTLDDDGRVIFLHLGRGVVKSVGQVTRGLTPEQWVRFVDETLLSKGAR